MASNCRPLKATAVVGLLALAVAVNRICSKTGDQPSRSPPFKVMMRRQPTPGAQISSDTLPVKMTYTSVATSPSRKMRSPSANSTSRPICPNSARCSSEASIRKPLSAQGLLKIVRFHVEAVSINPVSKHLLIEQKPYQNWLALTEPSYTDLRRPF